MERWCVVTLLEDERLYALMDMWAGEIEVPLDGAATISRVVVAPDESAMGNALDGGAVEGAGVSLRRRRTQRLVPKSIAGKLGSVAAVLILVTIAVLGWDMSQGSRDSKVTSATGSVGLVHPPASSFSNSPAYASNGPRMGPFRGGIGSASGNTNLNSSSASTPAPSTSATVPGAAAVNGEKIQKTGSVQLTVQRGAFQGSVNEITSLAEGMGGYVTQSQTQLAGGTPNGQVTIQVPVADFDMALSDLGKIGKVDSENTQAVDQTGQINNLGDQIQALQDSLAQYEKILSQATGIGDVLSVQNQIDSIQSQIKQLEGEQALLNVSTAYSTITVSVGIPGPDGLPQSHAPAPSAWSKSWHQAGHGFVSAVQWVLGISGSLLFVALVVLLILVAYRPIVTRVRRKMI